jgi:hypothetical protein
VSLLSHSLGNWGSRVRISAARERATEARKLRLDGIDPIEHKRARMAALRAADARTITFRECCEAYLRSHDAAWTNARHRAQWRSTLEQLYPILGGLPVQAIDTPLVLRAIKPIWEKTPVTASRLRGRLEAVLGWATVHHYRSGDNPAKWGGLLEHALPAPGKVAKVEHHSALPCPTQTFPSSWPRFVPTPTPPRGRWSSSA